MTTNDARSANDGEKFAEKDSVNEPNIKYIMLKEVIVKARISRIPDSKPDKLFYRFREFIRQESFISLTMNITKAKRSITELLYTGTLN